jgi:transcription factor WhiB
MTSPVGEGSDIALHEHNGAGSPRAPSASVTSARASPGDLASSCWTDMAAPPADVLARSHRGPKQLTNRSPMCPCRTIADEPENCRSTSFCSRSAQARSSRAPSEGRQRTSHRTLLSDHCWICPRRQRHHRDAARERGSDDNGRSCRGSRLDLARPENSNPSRIGRCSTTRPVAPTGPPADPVSEACQRNRARACTLQDVAPEPRRRTAVRRSPPGRQNGGSGMFTALENRADRRHSAAGRCGAAGLFVPVGTPGPPLVQVGAARPACRCDPVASDCVSWALANGPISGVCAGASEAERRALLVVSRTPLFVR